MWLSLCVAAASIHKYCYSKDNKMYFNTLCFHFSYFYNIVFIKIVLIYVCISVLNFVAVLCI